MEKGMNLQCYSDLHEGIEREGGHLMGLDPVFTLVGCEIIVSVRALQEIL